MPPMPPTPKGRRRRCPSCHSPHAGVAAARQVPKHGAVVALDDTTLTVEEFESGELIVLNIAASALAWGHHPLNLKSANAKKAMRPIAQNCEPPRLHTEVKSVGDSVHDTVSQHERLIENLFQGEKSDYVCCLECGNVTNTDAVLFGISNSLSLPTGPLAPYAPARTVPMPSWTCVKRYAKS